MPAKPLIQLVSPTAELIAKHGEAFTYAGLRLVAVLALERARYGANRLSLKTLSEVTGIPVDTVREVLQILRERGSLLVTDEPAVSAAGDDDEQAIEAACYGDGANEPPPVDQIGEDWTVGVC